MRRSLLVLLAILIAGCSQPSVPSPTPDYTLVRADAAAQAAYRYLLARQSEDGGWRSQKYPTYRDGISLSPLVIKTLLYGQPGPEGAAAAARGLEFLAPHMPPAKNKMLFPNYSLSIAALCFARDPAYKSTQEALVQHLRRQQMVEALGWKPDDLDYGGWGEAKAPYHRPKDGRVDPSRAANLSVTLFVLGALRVSGVPAEDPAIQKAQKFVFRCQNFEDGGDGGFFFSPGNLAQNKAGDKRSYGSMTADGLRALLKTGLKPDHPRVVAARKWLLTHFDPRRNPGEFPPAQENLREALYYYYCWSLAHALVESGGKQDNEWARPLLEELLSRQHPDGFWANPVDRMTEDEPLVATSMALAAVTLARSVLTP